MDAAELDFLKHHYFESEHKPHMVRHRIDGIISRTEELFRVLCGEAEPEPGVLTKENGYFFAAVPQGEKRDPSNRFELLTTDPEGRRGFLVDYDKARSLEDFCYQLARRNSEGFHIYTRFPAHNFIVFDDLDITALSDLKAAGILPRLVIRSSWNSYQGLIRLPEHLAALTHRHHMMAREKFCERFGSDKTLITQETQALRMPGFYNVRKEHFFDGRFPLVEIESSQDVEYSQKALTLLNELFGSDGSGQ